MKVSKLARREAKQLFRICLVGGLIDERRARQAVTQVIAQKPRGYVGILNHFQRLVKLDIAKHTAHVESAVPLTPEFKNQVSANLAARHGVGLNLSFDTNPALIGGMRIKFGSDVFDGSVQAKLASLTENV